MTVGRVHSFQSLGTLDGPGVRFVVFLQGCHLRCGCCHNPDTWDMTAGMEVTPEQILQKVVRYREYFRDQGGITVSGGEPLLQPEFVEELFRLCKREGIHTCLDTSGSLMNDKVEALLSVTDRVLLDIKYTEDAAYRSYVGCALQPVLEFLAVLNRKAIATTLRQVIIPTLNDSEENIHALKAIGAAHTCVDHIELLPFKKICQVKYDNLRIEFPFASIPEPNRETMAELEKILNQ